MKNLAIALLLIFVSFMASAATPESVQFQGLVRVNDGVPTRFDVQVPSGQQLVITLGDGSKLELATPGSQLSPDAAMARLLSVSGKALHTATYPTKGLASASLDYLVCHGRVTYISPAPATAPACSQE